MLENFNSSDMCPQDEDTAHTLRQPVVLLRDIFGDRIISKGSDFNSLPLLIDKTAFDFFL